MTVAERTAVLMGGADPDTGVMPDVPSIFTGRTNLDAMLDLPLDAVPGQGAEADPEQARLRRAVGLDG